MIAWAFAYGAQWPLRHTLRRPFATPTEHARAETIAQWLTDLATTHGMILAVTRHAFRTLLAKEPTRRG